MNFDKINDNIHSLTIPYHDIFTTVYTVKTSEGVLLFDTATDEYDVENYILPFIAEIGISMEEIKYIFISHNHKDHAGGLRCIMRNFPFACIVSLSPVINIHYSNYNCICPEEECTLMEVLRVVAIPGHTLDSAAIFDTRTNTLITGDCLQLYGIFGSGLWGANINFPKEHIEAVNKLKDLNIHSIYAAHNYHPCGTYACGSEDVNRFIDSCISPLECIGNLLDENPNLDDVEIADIYNSKDRLPTLGAHVVSAVREYKGSPMAYSAEKLKKDLYKIGIRQGDTVLLHSSYKSLGNIDGGAETFFKAFTELLGREGTLIVPALSFETVNKENPVFDIEATPSCVGYLSEFFRTRVEGVVRSMHATHSCCAVGKYADEITAGHEKDLTPVGKNSPFTKLTDYNGKILFLGCGLKSNTSMHGVEELVEPPYCIDRTETVKYILKDGDNIIEQKAYRHNFTTHDGKHIAQRYDRMEEILDNADIKHSYILSSESYLIDARTLWQKGEKKLMDDPLYFVDYPTD